MTCSFIKQDTTAAYFTYSTSTVTYTTYNNNTATYTTTISILHINYRITFISLIVSITKFSIVIGSPRVYVSRNRRAITCAITGVRFSNRTPVIGYPRDFHVNYARFNGLFNNVFYSIQHLGKALRTFSLKRSS